MPLPKPKKDEDKKDFLDRCMLDPVMKDEFDDPDQRYAVCNELWKKKDQEKKSMITAEAIRDSRKALAVHHTDTSEAGWDGPKNEARLKADQEESYYRNAFAWQDPDGDPKTKAAYKFIHHEVDGDGKVGAANLRGCMASIGVLNGARGGADIPDADRQGVYNHVAAHLKDADKEPAPLRSAESSYQRRYLPIAQAQLRADEGGHIVGYAAVFNQPTELFWGFREVIRPGAFTKTLQEGADVRMLWNHLPEYPLARTKTGTLQLVQDAHGLRVDGTPPDTQYARDFGECIRTGLVDQMSFGFEILKDQWGHDNGDGIREILEVKLFDVSPVTFAAYPQTEVGLRKALQRAGIDADRLQAALLGAEREKELLAAAETLRKLAEPAAAGAGADGGKPGEGSHLALEALRRRQMLAELQIQTRR